MGCSVLEQGEGRRPFPVAALPLFQGVPSKTSSYPVKSNLHSFIFSPAPGNFPLVTFDNPYYGKKNKVGFLQRFFRLISYSEFLTFAKMNKQKEEKSKKQCESEEL